MGCSLEKDCLVFLLGASGSGKSSVVQAGLIPNLSAKYKSNFVSFTLVPNKNPFLSFHPKFSDFNYSEESGEEIVARPDKNQENYKQTAVEYLEKIVTTLKTNPESYWLIVIDQFEEILTRTEADERFLFIQSLGNLISYLRRSENNSVKIILTMRIDFLDSFMQEFPDFVNIINSDEKKPFSYITPMTDRELKLVIKNPAATHGVNVDLNLIEEIIDDFRGEARSLPLLQYTLDLLWQKDDLSDRLLNKETYEELGKVGGALQQQAEKIYQDFEAKGQGKLVEDIFIQLVTITADGTRVSKRESKSKFTGETGKVVDELVKKHRLLVAGRQEGMVEVAHEALIGSWKRLQDWITKYEKEIILERQLKEAAQSWQKDKADEKKAISELWTGPKLMQVREVLRAKLVTKSEETLRAYYGDVTADFLKESWKEHQRRKKAEAERKQREIDSELSLANSLGRYSLSIFKPDRSLNALIEAIKAGKILQKHNVQDGVVMDALYKVLMQGRECNHLVGHQDAVYSVNFSPDGQTLASASGDHTLKLWQVATGEALHTLTGHESYVYSVSFSPDGQTLASASGDHTLKLWKIETEEVLHTLTGHKGIVYSVSFSPDGQTLVSGSSDNTLKLWHVETGKEILSLIGHKDVVNSVSFSPDGQTLASGSSDNTLKLWQVETGKELFSLTGHEGWVNSVSFSPDGQILVTGGKDNRIKLWKIETGEEILSLTGDQYDVISVSFSPDGQTLASGGRDHTIKLWKIAIGDSLRTLTGHEDQVSSLSFSPDGQTLASGSSDNTIKLWKVATGEKLCTLTGHEYSVNTVSFSPDGQTLASGSSDNIIRLWNVAKREELYTLKGHECSVNSVSFSPDGRILASCSSDNTIKLWKAATGEELRTMVGHEYSVNSVSFSLDGQTLASGDDDKTIKLWKVATGEELRTLTGHEYSFNHCVSFSLDGQTLASANYKTIKLWDLDFDSLMAKGCDWVRGYLTHNPNVNESDRHLCDGIGTKP